MRKNTYCVFRNDFQHVCFDAPDQMGSLGCYLLFLHFLCQYKIQWWYQANYVKFHVVNFCCCYVLLAKSCSNDIARICLKIKMIELFFTANGTLKWFLPFMNRFRAWFQITLRGYSMLTIRGGKMISHCSF